MGVNRAAFSVKRRKRRTDAPSLYLERLFALFITLARDRAVDATEWIQRFGVSKRHFQRHLLKLREIGKELGFTVTGVQRGRVFFHETAPALRRFGDKRRRELATLGRIASAMPGPIETEIRSAMGDLPRDDSGFLYVRDAAPVQSNRVDATYGWLKDAAESHARVTFGYTTRGTHSDRRVEPYHVVTRTGRYYLVAYDLKRNGWRHFALDAIEGPLRRDGTFTPRPVPPQYLANRSVGWIRSAGMRMTEPAKWVTVRLSPVIAASVTGRVWQDGQHVAQFSDGSADITLQFEDLAEAVRWSLSFSPDAAVLAPAEAVVLARETVAVLARVYTEPTALARVARVSRELRHTGGARAR